MSTNEQRMREWVAKIDAKNAEIFDDLGMEAERSITKGSEITTAPGQPVDVGDLLTSWNRTYLTPTKQQIATNSDHAQPVEDGIGPHGPRAYGAERAPALQEKGGSTVGGSHSVKITANGLQRLLDIVTKRRGGK